MAAPRHDPAVLVETLRIWRQYGENQARAADAIGIPRATFNSRLVAARLAVKRGALADERHTQTVGLPFERAWSIWQQYIGAAHDRYAGPAKPRAYAGRLRVCAAGDFHIPFHDKAALATLIEKEADRTDVLVIGGDFGDAHCASSFTKYERVSFDQEHAEKTLVLGALSEAFPRVIYLKGSNHTDRFEKRLRENLARDVLSAVMEMTGGILNPDLALVKRFPNVEIGTHHAPGGLEIDWITILGDVAFTHAESYSKVPGSVLRSLQERLDDNRQLWGLPPLRAICQFHTHSMALIPWRADMLLIEPGCLAQPMGYQLRAKGGGRAQRLGYVSLDLVDSKLDVNSVRLTWLDGARA